METLADRAEPDPRGGDPPTFILYNFIHPQGTRQAEGLKELTAAHSGLPACPVHLTQRASYHDAQAQGLCPQETEPEGKAAADLERLYLFVRSHVNMSEGSQHDEKQHSDAQKRAS